MVALGLSLAVSAIGLAALMNSDARISVPACVLDLDAIARGCPPTTRRMHGRSLHILRRCCGALVFVGLSLAGSLASANPGLEGARNLALGGATRASASGVSAFFVNPAAMSVSRTLAAESNYQVAIERNTHAFGAAAVDSLNNPRLALGLGYSSMIGLPRVGFEEAGDDGPRELRLYHRAHEVGLGIGVLAIRRWLTIGVKFKYQNSSLRFFDSDRIRRDAQTTHHAFGLDVGATLSIFGWVNLALVGTNLSGLKAPVTDAGDLDLEPFELIPDSFDAKRLPRISDYPRGFGHGIAVFPLHSDALSLNFDGVYDLTSYASDSFVRKTYSGGGEYMLGKLALRLGGGWDSRGPLGDDDRGFVSAGLGVVKGAEPGKIGFVATLAFRRDLSGVLPETYLGANIGLRFNPGY